MFETPEWKCTEDKNCYRKIVETKRAFKFLSGLDKSLDEVRGRILNTNPLPSLREAFVKVRQEESHKRIMMGQFYISKVPNLGKDSYANFNALVVQSRSTNRNTDEPRNACHGRTGLGVITVKSQTISKKNGGNSMESQSTGSFLTERYTTDGGSRDTLDNGTIPEKGVFSAVDFSTGEDPWPIFQLQKEYNAPGKSPPLSAEFYTGWLTHWGEKIAETDANYTAAALEKILSRNGSVVLYMAHGGTNFGFYSGANTGQNESDYKADLTSYDYDAPIKESGDVGNPKYEALRRVIQKYSGVVLPRAPPDNKKLGYGLVDLRKIASFNEVLNDIYDSTMVVKSEHPMSMETVGQMFGFMLYASKLPPRKRSSILKILKVHDRAQVFVSCGLDKAGGHPIYIGVIERWSNRELLIPKISCSSNSSLLILVENLGRLNYGQYISDKKGILSNVFIDGTALHGWQMFPIPLDRFSNFTTVNPIKQISDLMTENISTGPGIYEGHVTINSAKQIKDTFISFRGWNKGIAFVNDFNIGRFWPSLGPQCTLYVPAPLLREGENIVVILELHAPNPDFTINLVKKPDFTCGTKSRRNDNYRE
ncbi:beta-galactosidase 8-like isoform X2 [Zingiber officinale]|uniref:beta-galactosidase 8-like isoform X2 n=1 Tax=Zingiber officinale TaxID=94328 RepID=UPI001C4C4A49|nr:beta-galactosidase 8-like isoform X2 [Zingiber officinale]